MLDLLHVGRSVAGGADGTDDASLACGRLVPLQAPLGETCDAHAPTASK